MELPSNVENVHTEREDPSQFITHRAKDFVISTKEIEHRFFRAFESGREVSRLLEANKIMVGYSESKGKPSAMALLRAFCSVFHGGKVRPLSKVTEQIPTLVILIFGRPYSWSHSCWKRLIHLLLFGCLVPKHWESQMLSLANMTSRVNYQ
ncbi:hypothetical protein S83_016847 [Arachis hypogaea]|nr:uncharacterized protein DS421_5g159440 [Arachis hypogaea]